MQLEESTLFFLGALSTAITFISISTSAAGGINLLFLGAPYTGSSFNIDLVNGRFNLAAPFICLTESLGRPKLSSYTRSSFIGILQV